MRREAPETLLWVWNIGPVCLMAYAASVAFKGCVGEEGKVLREERSA